MTSLFLSEEELVKKDDDHKPLKSSSMRSLGRVPARQLLKRLALALAAGILVYLFVHNIPTDVPIQTRRPNYVSQHVPPPAMPPPARPPRPFPKMKPKPPLPGDFTKPLSPPKKGVPPPKGPGGGLLPAAKPYDGPIKFEKLANSLDAISGTMGGYHENKNILFVVSSLKSAALLLPMACQMGAELRSYVHFALMSRSDISIEQLREVNGVDDSCQLIFHDARPDFATTSSEDRFQRAVVRGMYHLNYYMHPQAVLVDASDSESALFLEAMRVQVRAMKVAMIELPEGGPSKLAWINKLDSASLASWHKLSIDILVQASSGTSGNLVRLLKSLAAADFSSSAIPHLTIELPNNVDVGTAEFLKTFQWPPAKAYNPTHANQLTIRHRIPRSSLTEEESSARFLESFWPANPRYSHVLVLSPSVELSRSFFHYLKRTTLQYLYSSTALTQQYPSRLLSISLTLPTTHLDATTPFRPPNSPFLWQAPNSNAVLFTGTKWTELHSFVSHLFSLQQTALKQSTTLPSLFTTKLITKHYPSWLEHALKLSRARGYWTLYPSAETSKSVAVVHKEMFRAPEEYEREVESGRRDGEEGGRLGGAGGGLLEAGLPDFDEMDLLMWDGKRTGLRDLDAAAAEYTWEVRKAAGGCEALDQERELAMRADGGDLFCLPRGA